MQRSTLSRSRGEFLPVLCSRCHDDIHEFDACEIEHHVSAKTLERLDQFVEFARDDPVTTESIRRFRSASRQQYPNALTRARDGRDQAFAGSPSVYR